MNNLFIKVFIVYCLIFSSTGCDKKDDKPKINGMKHTLNGVDKFYFNNLNRTEFNEEGNKYYNITAKNITHRNKRFRHLSINIFKEIFATNVHIILDNKKNNRKTSENNNNQNTSIYAFSSLEDSIKDICKKESISDINIEKFHVDFINDNIFTFIQTGHVNFNSFKKRLIFIKGLIITLTSGSKLIAQNGEWLNKERKLYIPNNFIIIDTKNNKLKGRNALIVPTEQGFLISH